MFATLHSSLPRTIVIANRLAGTLAGYRVNLHSLPSYTFFVEAVSGDDAHRMAYRFAKSEQPSLKDIGATFQRVEGFEY